MNKIHSIAFSGGGAYAFAQIGALVELTKYTDHIDIKNISSVSCGSIIGALYSVGYTPEEIEKIFFELNFDTLIRDSGGGSYYSLRNNLGLYSAIKFEEEIERLITIKTNIRNCTFSQCEKNLTIVATNLNYQKPTFFNKEETPKMVISKAVRMSSSYPIIMTPVLFDGDLYGDGGESLHYPITLFDNVAQTIGITCVAHNENLNGSLKKRTEITDVYSYIQSIATSMSRSLYLSQITQEYLDRSIIVEIPGEIISTQFDLTYEQKKLMFDAGKEAVQKQIGGIISK